MQIIQEALQRQASIRDARRQLKELTQRKVAMYHEQQKKEFESALMIEGSSVERARAMCGVHIRYYANILADSEIRLSERDFKFARERLELWLTRIEAIRKGGMDSKLYL